MTYGLAAIGMISFVAMVVTALFVLPDHKIDDDF